MAGAGMAKSLVVVAALMMLMEGIMAEKIIVGGTDGWKVQSSSPDFYKDWAKTQTFGVGDVLVFNFATGYHTVGQTLSKPPYDNCTSSDPSVTITKDGPAEITLEKEGPLFFFCTFAKGTHCAAGQKFTANVGPAKASSPSKSPKPSSSPKSFIISTFSLSALLALVIALLY